MSFVIVENHEKFFYFIFTTLSATQWIVLFAGIYFSDINPVQSPEIQSVTHDLDKSPTPLSLHPETCLEHDRALCCVPTTYSSLKQLHATQGEMCMERSNVRQPEGFNCDQHVNGSTKIFKESRNTKQKGSRHHQKRKPTTKISGCKVVSKATGSGSLGNSAGVRGRGKNKGQGRSNSCAEILHYNVRKSSPLFSDEQTNGFLFTKSFQDLAKLTSVESTGYEEPNIFYQQLSGSDNEERSESLLLDDLSEVTVCNEIPVNKKRDQHKVFRNSHNSHLYTFDNPSLVNLTHLTETPFGFKTGGGYWTEKDHSRNLPLLSVKTKNGNASRCYSDASLSSFPCEKQFLLTTFLSSDAEAEIEYKLRDPVHFPLCQPNTVPSSHGEKNKKEKDPDKKKFGFQEERKVKSADDQKFDVIVGPDGVVNCDHDRRPKTRGFNDFYNDSRFENVYSSQSDVPSQYVMLQSAKLRYYQTYVQSMRPKTPKREKWYGSASFGSERCPCCTPSLRPRNASPKLNEKCASPQCCQNLRLHPTPRSQVNSKRDDYFIPKRLTKSATYSNEKKDFSRTLNKCESLNSRKGKDYIVKRGRKFEPLEVKCLDIEDVFEVENNFDICISQGDTAVSCTERRSRLSDVKVNKSYVRSVSSSPTRSSNSSKTVRFKEGYEPKITGRSRTKSPGIPACISPNDSGGYSNEEWEDYADGRSCSIPKSFGKDSTGDVRSQLVELLNDEQAGKIQIEESNHHVCNKESTEELSNDDMPLFPKQNTESKESSYATDEVNGSRNSQSVLQSEDSFESNTSEESKPSESGTCDGDSTCSEVTEQDSLNSTLPSDDSSRSPQTLPSEDSSSRSTQTDMRQLLDLKPPAPRRKYSSESIPSIIISDEEGNENELDIENMDEEQEETEELEEDTATTDEENAKIREEFDRVLNLRRPKTGINRKGREQIRWRGIKDDEEISDSNREMLAPDTVFNAVDRVKRNKKKAKVEVHPQAYRQKISPGKEKKIGKEHEVEKGKLSLKNVNYFCSPDFLKMKVKKKVARKMKGMGIIQEQEWTPDSKPNQMAAPKIVVTEDTSSGTGNSSETEGDEDVKKHQQDGMLMIPGNVTLLNEENDHEEEDDDD